MFEYKAISQPTESGGISNNGPSVQIPKSNRRQLPALVAGTVLAICAFVLLGVSAIVPKENNADKSGSKMMAMANGDILQGSGEPLFIDGAQLKSSFCKISCSSPCSKFPSVYGELCCEWSQSSSGHVCALSISSGGICTCGAPMDSSVLPVPVDPFKPPSNPVNPVPVPVPQPAAAPSPASTQGAPAPGSNSGFHPFPTMSWNWNPYPTMAWLPFNPINIPENGTPCKRMCKHPCGWSQSNGESLCCETSNGGCDMAQINGQCYCG
eukprot:gene11934-25007_t